MVRREITPPNGIGLSRFGEEREMRIDGKTIVIYIQDEDDEECYYCTMARDYKLVSNMVNGCRDSLTWFLAR